jgi:hypothetical protein
VRFEKRTAAAQAEGRVHVVQYIRATHTVEQLSPTCCHAGIVSKFVCLSLCVFRMLFQDAKKGHANSHKFAVQLYPVTVHVSFLRTSMIQRARFALV